MKKHILSAVLCVAMVFAFAIPANAVEKPSIYVNGRSIAMTAAPIVVNYTTYVPCFSVVQAMYPDTVATYENGATVLRAPGLTLEVTAGSTYLVANGRYLYFPSGVIVRDGEIYLPVRTLAQVMGAAVTWDIGAVYLKAATGPILSGDQFYNADDLYWLSHIIYAESGNQPLEGMIAVGNVVLNRVNSGIFPNSVYDVVFQRNQFTPVQNGTIHLTPSAKAIAAAKLAMEGANTVGSSLYFGSTWASRNRPFVATIGAHSFYA